jgi:hypothetical protein
LFRFERKGVISIDLFVIIINIYLFYKIILLLKLNNSINNDNIDKYNKNNNDDNNDRNLPMNCKTHLYRYSHFLYYLIIYY